MEDWQIAEWREHAPWRITRQSIPDWLAQQDCFRWSEPVVYLQGDRFASVPPAAGVYALLFMDTLQYVGKATNLGQRVWAHFRQNRIPFDRVAWIKAPGEAAEVLEAYIIGEGLPPWNEKFCCRMEHWHRQVERARQARLAA